MKPEELARHAISVRSRAYAPYSGYCVGAALLDVDGQVDVGCNVENASFGLTCCAERAALHAAIARGSRRFVALAVASRDGCTPCGACRQVLSEFAPSLTVHLVTDSGLMRTTNMQQLLPDSFGPDNVGAGDCEEKSQYL